MTVEVVADVSGAVPLAALPALPRKQTDRKSSRREKDRGEGGGLKAVGLKHFYLITEGPPYFYF